MHTCIHAYMHTCIQAYMHTCLHTYIHLSSRRRQTWPPPSIALEDRRELWGVGVLTPPTTTKIAHGTCGLKFVGGHANPRCMGISIGEQTAFGVPSCSPGTGIYVRAAAPRPFHTMPGDPALPSGAVWGGPWVSHKSCTERQGARRQ